MERPGTRDGQGKGLGPRQNQIVSAGIQMKLPARFHHDGSKRVFEQAHAYIAMVLSLGEVAS